MKVTTPPSRPASPSASNSGGNVNTTRASSPSASSSGAHLPQDTRPTDTQSSAARRQRTASPALTSTPGHSQAHVNGQPYQVGANTPAHVKEFLSSTLSNNRYESEAHLSTRAKNFQSHIGAEKNILQQTSEGLKDPQSAVYQQTSWMAHLERGLWKNAAQLTGPQREQLSNEALGAKPQAGSPFDGRTGLKLSDAAQKPFSMMLKGEAGPLTQEQARAGFEMAQSGLVLAGRLGITERKDDRAARRVDASREGTHSTRTPSGMDLSKDLGTKMRDQAGLPVMSGTSGSSSDATIAAMFGAKQANRTWHAPELDAKAGQQAIADLSHHYFRAEGSSPPQSMSDGINRMREKNGLESKTVDTLGVFTHSYPEIHSGVSLTLNGAKGDDPAALQAANQEAAQRLAKARTSE